MFRGDRLLKLLEEREISQGELAKRVGISTTAIWKLTREPAQGSKHIHKIARELNTTPEYLMGESDDPSPAGAREARLPFRHAEPEIPAHTVMIPQLEIGFSMGGGSVFEEYHQTAMVPFPRAWLAPLMAGAFTDLFVARGEGDSMVPTLLDGDLVIVDTAQKQIRQQDRLWCLSYGDLGMIKRCRVLPDGGVQVNSDNPAVSPFTAHDEEMHVIGRVIWIGRRV